MSAKLLVALFVVALTSAAFAQPGPVGPGGPGGPGGTWPGAWPGAGGVNPWMPSWLSMQPWYPQWGACTTIGASCVDCTTRQVCTKVGGLLKSCTDPTLPYCNLGKCSATPSAECAPVPATTA